MHAKVRFSLKTLGLAAVLALIAGQLSALTVFPPDRAELLAKSRFDFKVEFAGVVKESDIVVTVNGQPYDKVFGKKATFIEKETGFEASAIIIRDVEIAKVGKYAISVKAGSESGAVNWEIFAGIGAAAGASAGKAKNVILLVADGLSMAHRTGARLLSKGITEGKFNGRLAMDSLDSYGTIGTAAFNSIGTDSANTAAAYNIGQKIAINALGVFVDRTKDFFDDPKAETLAEYIKRLTKKSIGIVSDAEIEDATPAAQYGHTRSRDEKAVLVEQLYKLQPEVVLGGGSAYFLPKSVTGSKRKDETNFLDMFTATSKYALATTRAELLAADPKATKLLGLFNTGNMDGRLDRTFYKKGTVAQFPDQPDLTEMTQAALNVLSKNKEGFFLQVEAGLVDKYAHPLDWERSVWDTIMFDKTVEVARAFAAKNPGTLIIVTGDHTHSISIIGTVDETKPIVTDGRDKVGVYDQAGFPNYVDADNDGYPDSPDVSRHLYVGYGAHPDYYETFGSHPDGVFVPAVTGPKAGEYVANEKYKTIPGAVMITGTLPRNQSQGSHTVDDLVVGAVGPGSEKIKGFLENTQIFRIMAESLGLGK